MYTVFLSHSTRDRGLVITLANLLTKFKVTVLVAEWYLSPAESLDKEIFTQIDKSDCVVALLTKHSIRSRWVHEEIEYDPLQPQEALIKTVSYIKSLELKKSVHSVHRFFFGVLYLTEKKRVPLDFDSLIAMASLSHNYRVEPLCVPIIKKSRMISRERISDPWDRLIAATSLHLGIPLITRDRYLQKLGLRVI